MTPSGLTFLLSEVTHLNASYCTIYCAPPADPKFPMTVGNMTDPGRKPTVCLQASRRRSVRLFSYVGPDGVNSTPVEESRDDLGLRVGSKVNADRLASAAAEIR